MLNEDNLIDLFVDAWRNLDAEIIVPYLAPDFEYTSCRVYSSLNHLQNPVFRNKALILQKKT